MKEVVIGRAEEQKLFKKIMQQNSAVFMAIYGRRRVGKTYLVERFFKDKSCIFFSATGIKDGSRRKQLNKFRDSLSECFYKNLPLKDFQNWDDAFDFLNKTLLEQHKNKKIVIFLDELPWLATKKSGLMQALDYYWNTQWSKMNNLKLIVCGSAASWMLNHLVYAKGGLHNRLTDTLLLKPFSLKETKEYLNAKGFRRGFREILDLYLALGGIPHYLNFVDSRLSATQNINQLCFTKNDNLFVEFDKLFKSLFTHYEKHEALIKYIAKYSKGVSREDIVGNVEHFKAGGKMLTDRLFELEKAGFISSYTSYEKKNWRTFYTVSDEYVLFYLRWILPAKNQLKHASKKVHYWENMFNLPRYNSWVGSAFEGVCYKHIDAIIQSLEIENLVIGVGRWKYVPQEKSADKGAEIDLLIERSDNTINICEIKSSGELFCITKEYSQNLINKMRQFKKQTGIKKELQLVFITMNGIFWNKYAKEIVCAEVNVEELFE